MKIREWNRRYLHLLAALCCVVLCSLSPLSAQAQGVWTTLQTRMTSPRDAHSLVQIGDRILLIGGRTKASGATTASAEWFDPSARTASTAAAMLGSRSFCPAVIVSDNTVLLAGGFRQVEHDTTIKAIERFDIRRNRWMPAGKLISARELYSATPLQDGGLLCAGGFSNGAILDTAEIYLSRRSRSRQTGTLHVPRFGHVALALPEGVLVIGGRTKGDVSLRSSELYNFRTKIWTFGPTMVQDRFRQTATVLADGRILITGGYSSTQRRTLDTGEIYDPATGLLTLLASKMSDGRMDHTATLLPNGRVLITGGWCSERGRTVASADLFDPKTGLFTPAAPLPASRHEHAALLLADGTVLICGGLQVEPGIQKTLDDLIIYQP